MRRGKVPIGLESLTTEVAPDLGGFGAPSSLGHIRARPHPTMPATTVSSGTRGQFDTGNCDFIESSVSHFLEDGFCVSPCPIDVLCQDQRGSSPSSVNERRTGRSSVAGRRYIYLVPQNALHLCHR